MTLLQENISLGDRRLVGQKQAIDQIERTFRSDRLSHAYLLTGPAGTGKTAFALAMAEVVNGVDHLTDLKGTGASKKSSWFTHPDIHLFMPLPSNMGNSELQSRLELLAEDPYEIVDFSLRPALGDIESSKNRRAFYAIDYYREEIRPKTVLRPNEGKRTVIIITGIDTMRKESANAFLKLLEEPSGNVMFILTASKTDQLLPTIVSRCQHIRLNPLSQEEVTNGLVRFDDIPEEDAQFLARVSGGNYALTRFLDLKTLQKTREQTIEFLRYTYTQDAQELLTLIQNWNSSLNTESQIALCNTLEQLLRDIMVYRETEQPSLIANIDQLEVIKKFCSALKDAKLEEMIEQLQELKSLLYQNVQFKLIFTSLSFRFGSLMRGIDTEITRDDPWKHLPAFIEQP
ncbi:MAG: AAA family ATPase [Balneolaceae bacterium]